MSPLLALLLTMQLSAMSPLAPMSPPAPMAPMAPVQKSRLVDLRIPTVETRPRQVETESRPKQSGVEYSQWYYRRLDLHRWGSYAMLPLFVAQYVAGSQLERGEDDDWAEEIHPTLAGGVAALFAANTVTGIWNLWEGRADPKDRQRRVLHAGLMLLANAGFVATGLLADQAEDDGNGAGAHKTVAMASMGVATVSWAIMLDLFRPN